MLSFSRRSSALVPRLSTSFATKATSTSAAPSTKSHQQEIYGTSFEAVDTRAVSAGDFSSVFKHTVLTALLENVTRYTRPFTFIDFFAGKPYYDITRNPHSFFTEPRFRGVDRVMEYTKVLDDPKTSEFHSYLEHIRGINMKVNEHGHRSKLKFNFTNYPGTASFVYQNMRPQDTYIAVDHEKANLEELKKVTGNDRRFKYFNGTAWDVVDIAGRPLSSTGIVYYDLGFHSIPGFYPTLPMEFHKTLLKNLDNRYKLFWEEHAKFEESPYKEEDKAYLVQEKQAGRKLSESISPSQLAELTKQTTASDIQQDLDKVQTTIVCINTELKFAEEQKLKMSAEKKQQLEQQRDTLLQYQALLLKLKQQWSEAAVVAEENYNKKKQQPQQQEQYNMKQQQQEPKDSVQFVPAMPEIINEKEVVAREQQQQYQEETTEEEAEAFDVEKEQQDRLQQLLKEQQQQPFQSFVEFVEATQQLQQQLQQQLEEYVVSGKAQQEQQQLLQQLDEQFQQLKQRVACGELDASISTTTMMSLFQDSFVTRTSIYNNYLQQAQLLLTRLNNSFVQQPLLLFNSLQQRLELLFDIRNEYVQQLEQQKQQQQSVVKTTTEAPKTEAKEGEQQQEQQAQPQEQQQEQEQQQQQQAAEQKPEQQQEEQQQAEQVKQEDVLVKGLIEKLNNNKLTDVVVAVQEAPVALEALNDAVISTMRLLDSVVGIQLSLQEQKQQSQQQEVVQLSLKEVETMTEQLIALSKKELQQSLLLLQDKTIVPTVTVDEIETTLLTCAHVEEVLALLETLLAVRFRQEAVDKTLSSDALNSNATGAIATDFTSAEPIADDVKEMFARAGVDITKPAEPKAKEAKAEEAKEESTEEELAEGEEEPAEEELSAEEEPEVEKEEIREPVEAEAAEEEAAPATPQGSHKELMAQEQLLQELKQRSKQGFQPLQQQLESLSYSDLSIALPMVHEHVVSFYERHYDRFEELRAENGYFDDLEKEAQMKPKQDEYGLDVDVDVDEEMPEDPELAKFDEEERALDEEVYEAAAKDVEEDLEEALAELKEKSEVEGEEKSAEEDLSKLEESELSEEPTDESDLNEITDEDAELDEAWHSLKEGGRKEEPVTAFEQLQVRETEPWLSTLVTEPDCHLSHIISNTQPLLHGPRQILAKFVESDAMKQLNESFEAEIKKRAAKLEDEIEQAEFLERLKRVDPVFRPFKTLEEIRSLPKEKRTALRELILDSRPGRELAIKPEEFDALMESNQAEFEQARLEFFIRRGRYVSLADLSSNYTPTQLQPVFERVSGLLKKSTELFPEAIHYVTFPLLHDADPRPLQFINQCVATGIKSVLYAEFTLDDYDPRVDQTRGQAAVILNPPLMFDKDLDVILQGMEKAIQRLHNPTQRTDPDYDMNAEAKPIRVSKVQWLTKNGPQGPVDRDEWKLNWDYSHYDGRVVKNELFESRVHVDFERESEELRLKQGPFFRMLGKAMLDVEGKPAAFNPGKFVRGPVLKYLARIQAERKNRNETLTKLASSLLHKVENEKKTAASPVPTTGDFAALREMQLRSSVGNMFAMTNPTRHKPQQRDLSIPNMRKVIEQARQVRKLKQADRSVFKYAAKANKQ